MLFRDIFRCAKLCVSVMLGTFLALIFCPVCFCFLDEDSCSVSAKILEEKQDLQEKRDTLKRIGRDISSAKGLSLDLEEKIDTEQKKLCYASKQARELKKSIWESKEKIKELERISNENKEKFEGFVSIMEQSEEGFGFVAFVFCAQDFGDFFQRVELVSQVSESSSKLIQKCKEDSIVLEEEREKLQINQEKLYNLIEICSHKKEKFQCLKEGSDDTVVALSQEEASAQEKIKQKEEQIRLLDKKLDDYYSDLQRCAVNEKKIVAEKEQIEAEKEQIKEQIKERTKEQTYEKQEQNQEKEETKFDCEEQEQNQEVVCFSNAKLSEKTQNEKNQMENGYCWPVQGYFGEEFITSYFGPRDSSFHFGVDISGPGVNGTEVVAADTGVVIVCSDGEKPGSSSGYCNYIMIDHSDGTSTLYGHLLKVAVEEGEVVRKGQVIGFVGSTGWSTGPHLHYEIRIKGEKKDPLNYYELP